MEKYCPNCGRVLGDVDFKLCPYCGTPLRERVGRQPIPGRLRHKVFQRDGYRCVECGATNKETTLEVDHKIPVSKGGTNDINNLQTLCKACNRAKHATIWEDDIVNLPPIESKRREIRQLKDEISKLNYTKNTTYSEEERIEINYKIRKCLERINILENEIDTIQKNEQYNAELQKEKDRKELLYKKYYVMDPIKLDDLLYYLEILGFSKDSRVRALVNIYTEEQINTALQDIKDFNRKDEKYYLEKRSEFYKNRYKMTDKTIDLYLWDWGNLSKEECQKRVDNVCKYTFFKDIVVNKEVSRYRNNDNKRCFRFKVKSCNPSFLGLGDDSGVYFEACCKKLGYGTKFNVKNKGEEEYVIYGYKSKPTKKDLNKHQYAMFEKLRVENDEILEYLFNKFPTNEYYTKFTKLIDLVMRFSEESIVSEINKFQLDNGDIDLKNDYGFFCPRCRKKIDSDYVFLNHECPLCSYKFKYKKPCPKCNFKNDSTHNFCIKCGTNLDDPHYHDSININIE